MAGCLREISVISWMQTVFPESCFRCDAHISVVPETLVFFFISKLVGIKG